MSITRLHHAQITIPAGAEPEARRFYCDLLGLAETEKPDSLKPRGGFWLQLGDVQIHLGTEPPEAPRSPKAHLAYQVDDLARWKTHLAERGVPIKESIPIPGFNRFEFRDPFGNRIEFIQPLPPEQP